MRNCNNCGGPPSIHHNGCDYCGTNVPIKKPEKPVRYFEGRPPPRSAAIPPKTKVERVSVNRVDLGKLPRSKAQKMLDDFWVPVERPSHNFNPRDWGHYDPRCHWWRTTCGHDVEIVRYYIERYGEEAPRAWQNDFKTDWPRRIR